MQINVSSHSQLDCTQIYSTCLNKCGVNVIREERDDNTLGGHQERTAWQESRRDCRIETAAKVEDAVVEVAGALNYGGRRCGGFKSWFQGWEGFEQCGYLFLQKLFFIYTGFAFTLLYFFFIFFFLATYLLRLCKKRSRLRFLLINAADRSHCF